MSLTFLPLRLPPYKTTIPSSVGKSYSFAIVSFICLIVFSASSLVALTPVPIAQTGSYAKITF